MRVRQATCRDCEYHEINKDNEVYCYWHKTIQSKKDIQEMCYEFHSDKPYYETIFMIEEDF